MIEALRSGQQCDEDGVMCIVSRQACHEAADIIEAQQARIKELERNREAWRELRHTSVQVSLEVDGAGVTEETHDRLTAAISATAGGWLS